MGVLGEFLGFDGRINRLGYLWRSIVAMIGIAVSAAAGGFLFAVVLRPQSVTGDETWLQWLTTGLVLLGLWAGFALATRRLRDMGLEPAHIVPVWAALWVVNTVLLAPMSDMWPQHYGLIENGWTALQSLVAISLLFWPSRRTAEPVRAAYEPAEPTQYLNWRGG
jgi:uncharacterized membrane protein YhaH (DUF805 family)